MIRAAALLAAAVMVLFGLALGVDRLGAPASGSDPSGPSVSPSPTPPASPPPSSFGTVPIRPATDAVPESSPAPASVRIDGLDLTMAVVPVGVEADGSMELPESVDEAGWYRFGPAPGSAAGTAVLAAHVDSADAVGPFARLVDLVPGAQIVVVDVSGTEHTYQVTSVERVAKETVDLAGIFARVGSHRLVLVTCGGIFDRDTGHYRDNVVVSATPS